MGTSQGFDVQRQVEAVVQDFRSSDPPMPVVVLYSDDDTGARSIATELCEVQKSHGTRCAVPSAMAGGRRRARPDEGVGAADARAEGLRNAIHAVGELSDPKKWNGVGSRADRDRSDYRRYAFPRTRFVVAVDDAVKRWAESASAGEADRRASEKALLRALVEGRRPQFSHWVPRRTVSDMSHVFPMIITTVVAATLAATLADVSGLTAALCGTGLVALLLILNFVPRSMPVFQWLRRECRWFMTTTFLRAAAARSRPVAVSPLRPFRSRDAVAARLYEVAQAMTDSQEKDAFRLRLHVLALLEDLRDNHRRWSWDLRGFKRLRPPMLFLPVADADNGGIELIKAVSDIRSRRSELDPLLVVAAVPDGSIDLLRRHLPADGGAGTAGDGRAHEAGPAELSDWHREWAADLRVGQSPSHWGGLPWVVRIPVPDTEHQTPPGREQCVKASTRRTVARVVWSAQTLALSLALMAGGTAVYADALSDRHCSTTWLTANRDTRRKAASGGRAEECIGIATDGVRFSTWLPGGDSEPVGGEASRSGGAPWSLSQLETRIEEQNEKALREGRGKYVTVVYAGPLSADERRGYSPVKGLEELGGVYLAQAVVNKASSVKLRVLVANGGVDLGDQVEMAELIAAYAERDPTLVGVVGTGRDLDSSARTTRILQRAGLPVVSGTNSATYLPRQFANWFGLAAPDEWQTSQLGLIARQLRRAAEGRKPSAMVVARDTEASDDRYTEEQARYGGEMLDREDFAVQEPLSYALSPGGDPEFRGPAGKICESADVPSVIYFAGRVEDVSPFMEQLGTHAGCADRKMSVITGDDLSKAVFAPGSESVAPEVTLYHAALAELGKAARGTEFYNHAAEYLPGVGDKVRYDSPALASGQTALSYDSTRALFDAASRDDTAQSRSSTWVNLRAVRLHGMATGTIDFQQAPLYAGRTGHSIALMEVRRLEDGSSHSRVVCSRVAGDTRPLTEKECAIGDGGAG
ncbi:ABC transporter substrate-binding protein [Streptomyces sp. NPDC002734]|uniref:ABC transporter substrate-binding protein n=1 Tax=Streptomyces sp. NPDC002734 TaxID=3154426 RepID=UPI003322EABA